MKWRSTGPVTPEVVHQAHVSLRRLRSLFSICKPMFEDIRLDHLREELRWLAGEFGDARNIDVMTERATGEELSHRLQELAVTPMGRSRLLSRPPAPAQ
ncbi:CHAD domain-containing protein [Ensifer sp. IC3342]|nr:CHAD domain-containing protein [Ensifer sp. BRP08]MCA1450474.1 CHAD domain-containing protein [Ensifer sp. IC3342]